MSEICVRYHFGERERNRQRKFNRVTKNVTVPTGDGGARSISFRATGANEETSQWVKMSPEAAELLQREFGDRIEVKR